MDAKNIVYADPPQTPEQPDQKPLDIAASASIQLRRSGLAVVDGVLLRVNRQKHVVARHTLRDLTVVKTTHSISMFVTIFGVAFLALAAVAKLYMPGEGWSWAVGIMLGVLGLGVVSVARTRRLRIEHNDTGIEYELNDDYNECDGFVASLIDEWQKAKFGR